MTPEHAARSAEAQARFLEPVRELHAHIREAVVATCERSAVEALSQVAGEEPDGGDTIYAIDRVSEEVLIERIESTIACDTPVVLVAEGLAGGRMVLPRGSDPAAPRWRMIVDPIDGTRGLMYGKRSAWILTGIAPELGPGHPAGPTLADVVVAVQTEIPTVKQHLCDVLWAVRGAGAHGRRINRLTGEGTPLPLRPSRARDFAHGFAQLARFFPGARDVLGAIDDELAQAIVGPPQPGRALCFEDQYICTGGQLYELIVGHDRFVADVRPLLAATLAARGWPPALCCHPYDLCTALIAQEAGVVITDADGSPLVAPLDVTADVAWVGYANAELSARVQPVLQDALRRHGLLEATKRA